LPADFRKAVRISVTSPPLLSPSSLVEYTSPSRRLDRNRETVQFPQGSSSRVSFYSSFSTLTLSSGLLEGFVLFFHTLPNMRCCPCPFWASPSQSRLRTHSFAQLSFPDFPKFSYRMQVCAPNNVSPFFRFSFLTSLPPWIWIGSLSEFGRINAAPIFIGDAFSLSVPCHAALKAFYKNVDLALSPSLR